MPAVSFEVFSLLFFSPASPSPQLIQFVFSDFPRQSFSVDSENSCGLDFLPFCAAQRVLNLAFFDLVEGQRAVGNRGHKSLTRFRRFLGCDGHSGGDFGTRCAGRLFSSRATNVRYAVVARTTSPVYGFSRETCTPISSEVRPVKFTEALSRTWSPTEIGARKFKRSTLAVTASRPQ